MSSQSPRRVALVTGASYGIGAACASALASTGFDIVLTDLDPRTLAETRTRVESLGARCTPLALDLREQTSIEAAMAAAVAACGGVDVLVNNAGVPLPKPALEVTRADWDKVMSVNLTGTFFMSQQMGRHRVAARRGGAIISIASTHGVVGYAGQANYGISKGGIVQMTRMLAIEWAQYGIRVNAVGPGKIETPSPARLALAGDLARRDRQLARIPLGRFGRSEEVAGLVSYLASDAAAYITGQTVMLDGGLTTQ